MSTWYGNKAFGKWTEPDYANPSITQSESWLDGRLSSFSIRSYYYQWSRLLRAWSDQAWTSPANLFIGPKRNSNSFSSSQKKEVHNSMTTEVEWKSIQNLAHAFPQELELQSLSFFLLSTRLVLIRYDRSESASRGLVSGLSPRAFIGLKFVLVLRSGSVLLQEFQDWWEPKDGLDRWNP